MLLRIQPGGQFTNLLYVGMPGLISSILIMIMIIASILFVFSLLIGGIRWMLSGGNTEKLDRAKSQLMNALIGLMIVFSAWAVLNLVSMFFGVDLISFEIPSANP